MSKTQSFSLKEDILIVDDSSESLNILTKILSEQGYKVRSVRSGKLAIRTAESTLPDLILLDIPIAEMDSYQVCKKLKLSFRTKDIPVIFVSALNEVFDKVKAFDVGGVDYITKPFQVEEVLARIENQLRFSRLSKQLIEQNGRLTKELEEHKRVKEELRESEQRFRSIFEQAAVGIAIAALDGQLPQVNQKLCDLIGYTPLEIQALNFQSITHPDDVAVELEYVRQCLAGERSAYSMEKRFIRKDGSIVWVNLSSSLVLSGTSELQYAIAVVEDISDRKLAERKLRETTFLYQQILDAIPDFILCKGSQSSIIYANKAFRDYYGMTMEQLQAIIDAPTVNPNYTQQYLKDDAYVLSTGQTLSIEEPVVRYDGQERLFNTVKSAVKDPTGQVIQTVGVSRDITERKQAEVALRQSEMQYRAKAQELERAYSELQNTQAQLIQAEKLSSLGQMLAGIAHEINNPTSFIYGNIQPAIDYAQDLLELIDLYRRYYPEPAEEICEQLDAKDANFIAEDFPKLLTSMKEGAERISRIVMSLRNFSRFDEKERQRVDIHEGIDNTLLILKHRLKQQRLRPEIQVIKEYGELPRIVCYPSQLNQVFMNILSNAIDAIDESVASEGTTDNGQQTTDFKPTIRIGTTVNDSNSVAVRIFDNGSGMTQEIQQKVFNPFFTTKPMGKGTGLGLAISYQIVVERHAGKLQCISAPFQGTEFLISLPIE
jgi:PAS domain S-box-containing protein